MRELLFFAPTLDSSFWTVTFIETMKPAGFLDYTIATFSSAGSNLWNHHNARFSLALPDRTQQIL